MTQESPLLSKRDPDSSSSIFQRQRLDSCYEKNLPPAPVLRLHRASCPCPRRGLRRPAPSALSLDQSRLLVARPLHRASSQALGLVHPVQPSLAASPGGNRMHSF